MLRVAVMFADAPTSLEAVAVLASYVPSASADSFGGYVAAADIFCGYAAAADSFDAVRVSRRRV